MSALRLARAASGRDRLIKFAGCYHGHADAFLVQAGSGATTLGVPTSPGVSRAVATATLVARYNDLTSVERLFRAHRDRVAALIVEPLAGNMGIVPPAPGFLEGLRALCNRHGAILIFDEVISGFRVSPGGAQERFGVRPDLTCLGKIIGGGLPVGAYGGRTDLMEQVAPTGPVYQAGTALGQPTCDDRRALGAVAPFTGPVRAPGSAGTPIGHRAGRRRPPSRARPPGQRLRLGSHAVLCGPSGARLRHRHQGRHRHLRAVLPGHARPRRLPCRPRSSKPGSCPGPTRPVMSTWRSRPRRATMRAMHRSRRRARASFS